MELVKIWSLNVGDKFKTSLTKRTGTIKAKLEPMASGVAEAVWIELEETKLFQRNTLAVSSDLMVEKL